MDTQKEFNNFYDGLRRYAFNRASKRFHDISLREEVVDIAMDRVIDWMVKGGKARNKEAFCKTIIKNSLKNSDTRWKVEACDLKETVYNVWGFRGRKFRQ